MATILDPTSLVGRKVVLLLVSAPGMPDMRLMGTVTEYDRVGGVVRLAQTHCREGEGRWLRTRRVTNRPVRVRSIAMAEIF